MKYDIISSTKNITRGKNSCERIVLHHTGGWSFEWNLKTLTVWSVSCHYLIWQDGKIAKIWKDEDILRHCGDSRRKGRNMMNPYCIGIEIVNDKYDFTDTQRLKVRELVKELMKIHNIPAENIIRHKDIAPERKVDVYDTFRNNEFKTFTDYQNSYKKIQYTFEEIETAKSAVQWNSKLRHTTTDDEIKKDLNNINTKIRQKYWFTP